MMGNKDTTYLSLNGEKVSKKRLVRLWKSLTKKPFPYGKIRACILDNAEMNKFLEIAKDSNNIQSITIPEYGKEVPLDEKTAAVIFIETKDSDTKSWMILVRKESQVSVVENLEHELNHIINGDITLNGSVFKQ